MKKYKLTIMVRPEIVHDIKEHCAQHGFSIGEYLERLHKRQNDDRPKNLVQYRIASKQLKRQIQDTRKDVQKRYPEFEQEAQQFLKKQPDFIFTLNPVVYALLIESLEYEPIIYTSDTYKDGKAIVTIKRLGLKRSQTP